MIASSRPAPSGGERDEADQPRREAPPAVAAGALLLPLAASRLEPDLSVFDGLEVRVHAVWF